MSVGLVSHVHVLPSPAVWYGAEYASNAVTSSLYSEFSTRETLERNCQLGIIREKAQYGSDLSASRNRAAVSFGRTQPVTQVGRGRTFSPSVVKESTRVHGQVRGEEVVLEVDDWKVK